ncbi:MAG: transglycosylase [Methylotenera sp.]|nr:MAG: transglycosylase [Methylotenera sp.]
MLDAIILQQCAPMVNDALMHRVVSVESSHNPYAIGIVHAHLQRQPQNLAEAKATAQYLEQAGYNYSAGIAQVNRRHFARFNLTLDNVFNVCPNLNAGGQILAECLSRANRQDPRSDATLKALSCYYSGRLNSKVGMQYANKVLAKLTDESGRNAQNRWIQAIAPMSDKSTKPASNYTSKRTVHDDLSVADAKIRPEFERVDVDSAVVF